jgi:prepilin signal peptidase PulO-like enzyme (type II secretory pathway)
MIVGGAFAKSSIGYRGSFWLSFGLSALFSILAVLLLPPTLSHGNAQSLNYVGTVITTAAGLLIVFSFTKAPESYNQAKAIANIVIGVLLIRVFIL